MSSVTSVVGSESFVGIDSTFSSVSSTTASVSVVVDSSVDASNTEVSAGMASLDPSSAKTIVGIEEKSIQVASKLQSILDCVFLCILIFSP